MQYETYRFQKMTEKTGKTLATQDIDNCKSRSVNCVTTALTSEAHGALLLEQLHSLASKNPNWIIHYEKDNKNELLFVLFQTSVMRETLEKYPEILFIDGTYKVNVENVQLVSPKYVSLTSSTFPRR